MPAFRRFNHLPTLLAPLVAVAIIAGSQPARACMCQYPSPEKFVADSTVIFSGIVVLGGFRIFAQAPVRYTILVTRVWKGRVPPLIDVISRDWQVSCGVRGLHIGAEFPMFASSRALYYGAYRINGCSVGPRRGDRRFERYWRAVQAYARAHEIKRSAR
jgi:hypothetical protein